MAVNGEIEVMWADGKYKFNIAKIGQILELEENCKCGFAEICTRVRDFKWHINDLHETIRLALIGGGMEPSKALILVKRYVDDRPYMESIQVAQVVLMAALVGIPGDDIGKKQAAERAAETQSSEMMAESSAPQSMESVQLSDGRHDKQMN